MQAKPLEAERKLGFSGTNASVILDGVRGFAAIEVFSRHWRNVWFVDYPKLPAHKMLLAGPYLITALGHQAVLIFFVLSGYLIGGSVVRAVDSGTFHWGRYMTRRLSRLWIVLLPALLLTLLVDRIGMGTHRAELLYGGAHYNNIVLNVNATTSWKIFLGNMAFLQDFHVPALGSNGALWTLSYEFWYYIIFILGWLIISKKTKPVMRVVYVLLIVAYLFVNGVQTLNLLPVWLLGVVLLWCKPPKVTTATRVWVTVPYFAFMLYVAKAPFFQRPIFSDYPMAIATVLWLWIQLSATGTANPRAIRVRTARWFSRLAFTMYAIHLPLCVLIASIFLGNTRLVPTPIHILAGLAVFVVVLGCIYALASVTEFQTDPFRRRLDRMFGFDKHPRPNKHEIALSE